MIARIVCRWVRWWGWWIAGQGGRGLGGVVALWAVVFWFGLAAGGMGGILGGMVAYYPFEQDGEEGMRNKAPGAVGGDAVRGGSGGWFGGGHASGPGFPGSGVFDGGDGVSDRSARVVGRCLNLVDLRGDWVRLPLGTAELGAEFSVAVWHALAPGGYGQAAGPFNGSNRYHVFEASDNYDVSWGTGAVSTAGSAHGSYPYLAYVGGGPAGGFGPAAMATGVWHHVVHVFRVEGGNTRLEVYCNGVFVDSRTASTAAVRFEALHFGRQRGTDSGDRDWDGMLDELAVWSRALTADEVAEVYRTGKSGLPLNAVKAVVGLEAVPVGAGRAVGGGTYEVGQVIEVRAEPAGGYVFAGWEGGLVGQSLVIRHVVVGDLDAKALFAADMTDDDGDGLSNHAEWVVHGSDAGKWDSDGDGLSDGEEVGVTFTDPAVSDLGRVELVRRDLSVAGAGGLSLGRPVVAGGDRWRVVLRFRGSVGGEGWDWVPAVRVDPRGGWELLFPVGVSGGRSFRLVDPEP